MKRILSVIISLVVSICLLSGCNSETKNKESSSSISVKNASENEYTKKITVENVTFYVPADSVEEQELFDDYKITRYLCDWGYILLHQNSKETFFDDDYAAFMLGLSIDKGKEAKIVTIDDKKVCYAETNYDDPAHDCKQSIDLYINSKVALKVFSNESLAVAKEHYEEFVKHITIEEEQEPVNTTTTMTSITTTTAKSTTKTTTTTTTEATTTTKATTTTTKQTDSVEETNASRKAQSYLEIIPFSRDGLIEQLEYEGFSHDSSVKAVDNCGADWNEQAAKKAESYIDMFAYSKEELIEQLEYDKFTYDQALYGAQSVGY